MAGQQQTGQRVDLRLGIWLAQRPVPSTALAQRLGDWLDWTDAVTLAQAVSHPLPESGGFPEVEALRDWAQAALLRVQAELRAGFEEPSLVKESAQPWPDRSLALADLLAPYRLHHSQQQRSIAARCASLRERLHERFMASAVPRLQQLALLDHALSRALDERLRLRLAGMPAQLALRAERFHAADPRHCRAPLWKELVRALELELDLRLLPLQGLVEALNETP